MNVLPEHYSKRPDKCQYSQKIWEDWISIRDTLEQDERITDSHIHYYYSNTGETFFYKDIVRDILVKLDRKHIEYINARNSKNKT